MTPSYLLLSYLSALDSYRADPNRMNKDLLMEAEYDARKEMGLETDHLEELYRNSK